MDPFSAADLERAESVVRAVARETPVVPARWLSDQVGAEVFLKCENLQRSGSFKVRGAYLRMSGLSEEERARGVVAASAGNHAQGVAVAARALGLQATVFMPSGAALPKVAATREYGAQVELVGSAVEDAIAAAREFADRTGAALIHPFDHPDIVAGQAGVGMEILRQVPDVRTVLVPTGGGGLLAGVASAVQAMGSRATVLGVQADGAAAYPPSLAAGHPLRLPQMATMADGIAVAEPGAVPLGIVAELGVEVRTVSEDSLARALVLLLERSKQVVEPAGAPGVASLLQDGALPGPIVAVLSPAGTSTRSCCSGYCATAWRRRVATSRSRSAWQTVPARWPICWACWPTAASTCCRSTTSGTTPAWRWGTSKCWRRSRPAVRSTGRRRSTGCVRPATRWSLPGIRSAGPVSETQPCGSWRCPTG